MQNYYEKKEQFNKMRTLNKADKICLVLDNKSDVDWYKNGRFLRANWQLNLKFYNDIISLQIKIQRYHFYLNVKICTG